MEMQVFTYYNGGNIFEYLTRFTYRKYIYNNQNQVERIEIAQSLNPLSCAIIPGTSFEDGDDPRQAPIGQVTEFEYSGTGKLNKKRFYFIQDDSEHLMNYEVPIYDGEKIVRIDVFNPKNQLTHYYTYQYDSRGNVVQEDYYVMQEVDEGVLQSRILSEFDEMHNPFRVFAVECTPGDATNLNNIVRQTTLYYYNEDVESYTQENEYEYNDMGYPVLANNMEYIYGEGE
jgi:hypothetical protein